MSEETAKPTTDENVSDDDEQHQQDETTNPLQKKEDAKVEKELDRVTDRVDDEEIGSEQIGNVRRTASSFSSLVFVVPLGSDRDQRQTTSRRIETSGCSGRIGQRENPQRGRRTFDPGIRMFAQQSGENAPSASGRCRSDAESVGERLMRPRTAFLSLLRLRKINPSVQLPSLKFD